MKKSIKSPVTTIVAVAILVAICADLSAQATNGIGRQQFITELKSENLDRIKKSLNEVKEMVYPQDLLPVISDLWEQRTQKYPDLPWPLLKSDIVRIELADVILQESRNGLMEVHRQEIHDYLRPLIASADADVARSAILALAWIDDQADVPALVSVARNLNPHVYRASVISLSRMCNSQAAPALKSLSKDIRDSDAHAFISKVRKDSDAMKEKTKYCNED